MRALRTTCALTTTLLLAVGCGADNGGSGIDPTDVAFGDTALVVVVNPIINDANDESVPTPGATQAGVTLRSDDGLVVTTGLSGVAVLAPLSAGARTITVEGEGVAGSFSVMMAQGELREIALASADAAQIMIAIDYKTDRVVEINPEMSNAEVNQALSESDAVVFLAGGRYQGDIDFSGSRVTLFGEGALGGQVIIEGDVTISGSDSRVRGAHITGDLNIPASGVGVSFSQIDGITTSGGSDAIFLANALCGEANLSGSGTIVLGNAGIAPLSPCE